MLLPPPPPRYAFKANTGTSLYLYSMRAFELNTTRRKHDNSHNCISPVLLSKSAWFRHLKVFKPVRKSRIGNKLWGVAFPVAPKRLLSLKPPRLWRRIWKCKIITLFLRRIVKENREWGPAGKTVQFVCDRSRGNDIIFTDTREQEEFRNSKTLSLEREHKTNTSLGELGADESTLPWPNKMYSPTHKNVTINNSIQFHRSVTMTFYLYPAPRMYTS